MLYLLLSFLLASTTAQAGKIEFEKRDGPGRVNATSPNFDIEKLYTARLHEDALSLALQRMKDRPDDADLYWHVARGLFERGEAVARDDPDMDKLALYSEMMSYTEKGLEVDPGNPHLLFAHGIAVGRYGTTKGVLASVGVLKEVEQSWQAAAYSGYRYESIEGQEHLPCDAFLTLGIFYRIVPDWWVVKMLSGTRGDIDEALKWLRRADKCRPNRIRVVKELGIAQLCKADRDSDEDALRGGLGTIARAVSLPIHPSDKTAALDRKHSLMLLDNPALACEYSRDGQQDLDESKLDGKKKKDVD